ncbi:uncharacterized protein HMPREF1541_04422 [Cyphellophora europaea CBS 101466]|uniref:BRCT domain-containing protein n=1 Tax=Cyphellophora europaea (strain CBS 101466) TaxID=1220924 RepID=W2RUE6_CYPE1|nr:uncharacterized protein HMPREF1541_04422 [Cyphellophora europaea CBS 101466]ETN40146.1 hypothetical protein HMPREF1541_04422 [Cyphellophora europaea CBS 101466]
MPAHNPPIPKAPQPTKVFFDPYNSSSTGHQRAENRLSGSTSWRDSRTYKLKHQFSDATGRGGTQHLSDLVGAGSENFGKDGRKENGDWEQGAPGLREYGWQDIRGLLGGGKKRKSPTLETVVPPYKRRKSNSDATTLPFSSAQPRTSKSGSDIDEYSQKSTPAEQKPQIFASLSLYLNGSTAPLISDHRLKQLFSQHGGTTSLSLARRSVTHVVIGEDCGGGLAGTKIQKEVQNVRGKGVKFVTAQWVLDSVERGKRQAEGKYVPKNLRGKVGGSGQGSVAGMFQKK